MHTIVSLFEKFAVALLLLGMIGPAWAADQFGERLTMLRELAKEKKYDISIETTGKVDGNTHFVATCKSKEKNGVAIEVVIHAEVGKMQTAITIHRKTKEFSKKMEVRSIPENFSLGKMPRIVHMLKQIPDDQGGLFDHHYCTPIIVSGKEDGTFPEKEIADFYQDPKKIRAWRLGSIESWCSQGRKHIKDGKATVTINYHGPTMTASGSAQPAIPSEQDELKEYIDTIERVETKWIKEYNQAVHQGLLAALPAKFWGLKTPPPPKPEKTRRLRRSR